MISVCMATYNGEKFIKRQLESILCQLAPNDEVVISDDGSTDRTLDVVSAFMDERIRVLHHQPCGVAFNFENAIKEAKGDFVFLSDQDDVWLSNKVARCLKAFESGADLILHNGDIVDSFGNKISVATLFDIRDSSASFIKNLMKNSFIGCCMAFRSSYRSRLFPFPKGPALHDEWIGLRMSYLGANVILISDVLLHYCQHGNNVSSTAQKSTTSLAWKVKKRICMLWCSIMH